MYLCMVAEEYLDEKEEAALQKLIDEAANSSNKRKSPKVRCMCIFRLASVLTTVCVGVCVCVHVLTIAVWLQ